MENIICSKSNNEEEYLTFAASLLSKMREESEFWDIAWIIHFCDLLDKRIANEGNNNRDNASARLEGRNTFQNSIKSYINVMPTMQRQESAVEAACDLVSSKETNASSQSQHTNHKTSLEINMNSPLIHKSRITSMKLVQAQKLYTRDSRIHLSKLKVNCQKTIKTQSAQFALIIPSTLCCIDAATCACAILVLWSIGTESTAALVQFVVLQ